MLEPRPWIRIRGLYGGFPQGMLDRGETPADYGINAIWVGSGSLDPAEIERYHKLGMKVFVEFNSMHEAGYLKEHPEAAPIGPDGKPCRRRMAGRESVRFTRGIGGTGWTSSGGC